MINLFQAAGYSVALEGTLVLFEFQEAEFFQGLFTFTLDFGDDGIVIF